MLLISARLRSSRLVPLLAVALCLIAARPALAGPMEDALERKLSALDLSKLQTGILYDRVLPLSGIERFGGASGSPKASAALWMQVHDELRRASLGTSTALDPVALRERAQTVAKNGVIPLGLIAARYERIRLDAIERGALRLRDGRLEPGEGPAFEMARVFTAAALRERTRRGAEVAFRLDPDLMLLDPALSVTRLEIDLADGGGRRALRPGETLVARFASVGPKTMRVEATLADGSRLQASFGFVVEALVAPSPNDTLEITATIPYQGAFASGHAYVDLAPIHAGLLNPVVVVEGFDLDNTMGWDQLYELLNRENLLETLRADGYDVVVLDFTDATVPIQANAFVLTELIEQIQAAIPSGHTIAIAGASMGALVGRYALAWLENQGIGHRVRTFLSFDGPHQGADIPLGIQYWVQFFSGSSSDAAYLLSRLDRPAARQMLIYHYTDPAGTTGQPDPLRAVLLSDFAALGGYPTEPRNVAIANGSGTQQGQGFAPGDQIVRWEYSAFLINVTGNVWAVPDAASRQIFQGRYQVIFPDTRKNVTVSATLPYDNAPGGWRSSMADMDSTAAPLGDIVALHPNHCFIPTVSALDLSGVGLFHDVAGDPALLQKTPFDAVQFPVANQEHVLVTAENAVWIRSELEQGVTGVGEVADARGPRLEVPAPNPASGTVRIAFALARAAIAEIAVFGVDGRRVRTLGRGLWNAGRHEIEWGGVDELGRPARAGIYFVRLLADGRVESRRIVRTR